jgi:uncharacterized membrane protein YphA (DoxX/SURF4 family)
MVKINSNLSHKVAIARILFGLVWAIDAFLKFQPAFYNNLLQRIKATDSGEPKWLNFWYHTWYHIVSWSPHFFSYFIVVAEVLIAVSLLLGIARRFNYIFAAIFTFLIWGVGEAFGGPYVAGSTDIGAGFIYVIVFICLYYMDGLRKPSWSLDPYIEKRFPPWAKVANPPKLK